MPSTLLSSTQGYGQVQTIITREHGIRSLGSLDGQTVDVWTGDEWQSGKVEYMGDAIVLPAKYCLSRPTGLMSDNGTGESRWARRGGRETMVFATEGMSWKLVSGQVITPMLEDRVLPTAAPVPNMFSDEFKRGQETARKVLTRQEGQAGSILGSPRSEDFVFGVIMQLTRLRSHNHDERRRVLYHQRRDIIDWISQNSVLGGYLMTTQVPPKIILDPANETLGWKHSGNMNPPTKMKVYQVKNVDAGMMTLGNGTYVMSEVT